MCVRSFQYLRWTTAVKRSCVTNRDKASPAMSWHHLCDARKTNALHHSCSVSWFISSSGYSNCQSVANCQCNVPLTAALHTFPSPRWPMPNSIFKFRRFETASRRVKEMKKGKRKINVRHQEILNAGIWMLLKCATSITASSTTMVVPAFTLLEDSV